MEGLEQGGPSTLLELPPTVLDHLLGGFLDPLDFMSAMTTCRVIRDRLYAVGESVQPSAAEEATFNHQDGTPRAPQEESWKQEQDREYDPYEAYVPHAIEQRAAIKFGQDEPRPCRADDRDYVPNLANRWGVRPEVARRCSALYATSLQTQVPELANTQLSVLVYYVRLALSYLSSHEFTFNHNVKRGPAPSVHGHTCQPRPYEGRTADWPDWPHGYAYTKYEDFQGIGIPCNHCMRFSHKCTKPQFIRTVVTTFVLWSEPTLLREHLLVDDELLYWTKELLHPEAVAAHNRVSSDEMQSPFSFCVAESEDILCKLLLDERGYDTIMPAIDPHDRLTDDPEDFRRCTYHWERYKPDWATKVGYDIPVVDDWRDGWWPEMKSYLKEGNIHGVTALSLALVYVAGQDPVLAVWQQASQWWYRPQTAAVRCQHSVFGPIFATLIRMALAARTTVAAGAPLQRVIQQRWSEICRQIPEYCDLSEHPKGHSLLWCAARQWRFHFDCQLDPAPEPGRTRMEWAADLDTVWEEDLSYDRLPWNLDDGSFDPHSEPYWASHRAAKHAKQRQRERRYLRARQSPPVPLHLSASDSDYENEYRIGYATDLSPPHPSAGTPLAQQAAPVQGDEEEEQFVPFYAGHPPSSSEDGEQPDY